MNYVQNDPTVKRGLYAVSGRKYSKNNQYFEKNILKMLWCIGGGDYWLKRSNRMEYKQSSQRHRAMYKIINDHEWTLEIKTPMSW